MHVKSHKQQTEILITKNFLLQLLTCQISICAYSNCTIEIWEEDMTIAYHFSDIVMVLFLFVCLFLEFETLWLAITFFISMNILSYISFCDLKKWKKKNHRDLEWNWWVNEGTMFPIPLIMLLLIMFHKINKLVSCFKMSQWHEKEEMRHVTLLNKEN